MNCPSEQRLLRALVGELTVNEAASIARHRESCPRCRALASEHERLLADLGAPPVHARSDEAFIAGVLAACDDPTHPRGAPAQVTRPRALRWSPHALVAAAALAVASLTLRRADDERSAQPPAREHIAARGASEHDAPRAFADLLFVRAGVAARLSGAALRAGDALAVRCTNRADQRAYLAVFVLDARGATHWIYPAYSDESADPSSIAIEPHLNDRLLDEVVEPADPAPGALRAYAVWSSTPLSVHAIEAHVHELSASGPDTFFARTFVQRWSATWHVR